MSVSPVNFQTASTQLNGRLLSFARLIWVVLLLLTIGKTALGFPLYYAEIRQVCTTSAEVCSQGNSLTPQQVGVLQTAGVRLDTYAKFDLGWEIITSVIWFSVGLLIFLLRPHELLALIASAMMIVFISAGYETQIQSAYPAWGTAADLIFNLGNILLFPFIGLFPGGRFAPRWMRWYWLAMIVVSLPTNSFWHLYPEIFNLLIFIVWASFLILGPYSQIYRYRNESTSLERQQTKWVVWGFALFAGAVLVGFAIVSLFPEASLGPIFYQTFVFDLAGMLIPLSIGISVLRYRLWDIDVIIRKTVQYVVLTAVLALVYFGTIILLQTLVGQATGEQSPLIIVLSTLLIAALFTPLRRRIQAVIDRRFFRKKYNAQQVLAQFAQTARDETDMDALQAELLRVVQETMQPERVGLWLNSEGS
ncbi:MAG: hypothetical protein KF770_27625 [Anaerolineae bacterium]|nr:hypothetical protein [Anaerolineae bacterium]